MCGGERESGGGEDHMSDCGEDKGPGECIMTDSRRDRDLRGRLREHKNKAQSTTPSVRYLIEFLCESWFATIQ